MGNVFGYSAEEPQPETHVRRPRAESAHTTTGVDDILKASVQIQGGTPQPQGPQRVGLESSSGLSVESRDLGSRLNAWQRPGTWFGLNNGDNWEKMIQSSPDFGCMEIDRKQWARSKDTVDAILQLVLKDIIEYSKEYKGLKIVRYIRQGSSREGLKVIGADEFDTLLLYYFEGFSLRLHPVQQEGKVIPEFCKLIVSRELSWLETNCPKLYREGVFEEDLSGRVMLNARALHQGVFESMIDRSVKGITAMIQLAVQSPEADVPFRIRRKMNPPSINITIDLDRDIHQHFMPAGRLRAGSMVNQIDVDIVPGINIRTDQVPDPVFPSRTMECPVYAVFKWQEESSVGTEVFGSRPGLTWRICSSGYEKHTLDVARRDPRLRYLITALRLLKTFFSKVKSRAKAANQPPPPITTVLRSYHLKHIAFYLILFLGYLHTDATVRGVKDALEYFIALLNISLEKGRLPHFFHSNNLITVLYPEYHDNGAQLRFNLLRGKSAEALHQAKLSLRTHVLPALDLSGAYDLRKMENIKIDFTSIVSYGEFF